MGCSGNDQTRERGDKCVKASEGRRDREGPWDVAEDCPLPWSSPYLLMDVREMLAEAGML